MDSAPDTLIIALATTVTHIPARCQGRRVMPAVD